ncbi:Acetylornithine/succinyldiaminopimelate aminotransferase [Rhodococcus sp. B10]|nr:MULTISPECIES: diaminobutyrate--2-oxoglutarate transaminase [Rhodococcus]NIL78213.1 Acetylornithine/succinyldiaminopimelate aminotransferase [Rhodococcus sp. B10]RRQ25049.1 diaminobutyrate--2-oxoglutarate transaminase [Rhodococcus sp. Eu-32]
MKPAQLRATPITAPDAVTFRSPQVSDGVRLWEIARDSRVLDLNSSYAYVLWCRDFAATSVVSDVDGRAVGFVTGYIRQDSPTTFFVWQVAVDADQRGKGLAGRMLNELLDRLAPQGITHLETTISPDNEASIALFTALARTRGTDITKSDLFAPNDFPDSHEAEELYTVGPATVRTHERNKQNMTESTITEKPDVFETVESGVRSYSRQWPAVFKTAKNSTLVDENGREYLDFFGGAGALNYGHNNDILKGALVDYIQSDGITHGLDMSTVAKREFLESFKKNILDPRGLDYKVQFPGPTGANTVEAALKLARKVTGREAIINFTNAFHGMTLGALSVTGNSMKRAGAGIPLVHTTPMPYDNYFGGVTEDFQWFERVLDDSGSGINRPAAVIVETIQGEGGINVARPEWLRALAELCSRRDILLIVDDVQMGCGRTGQFFSFEEAGIVPDIVTLSKSVGGYGMPMALTLFKPELDVWAPGEHNGTFRGFNPSFVTSKVAIETYWSDDTFEKEILAKGAHIQDRFIKLCAKFSCVSTRGRGMVQALAFEEPEQATKVAQLCYDEGLLVETAGPSDEVVKLLPPLTTTLEELDRGLDIIESATAKVCS